MWHDNAIPADEVWIKLCGDKGGRTFKLAVQIANVASVNSVKNTFVITYFEAADTVANLNIAIGRYQEQLQELTTTDWM